MVWVLAYVGGIAAIVYGWVTNIVILVQMAGVHDSFTSMMILRAIGIFVAPMGVVLGYI